jgi:hypothetical protein
MSSAHNIVNSAKHEVAPWVERLARLGYASVGVVYAVMGVLAMAAGLGQRRSSTDQHDVLMTILEQPFGHVLLAILALGLLGYALWRFVAGFNDSERRGRDAKGLALRAGSIFRGIFYTGFAIEVVRLALRHGGGNSGGGDAKAKHWTATLMDKPFGRWIVGIAGLVVVGYGIYQVANAWRAKLSKQLRLDPMQASMRRRIICISRFGIGARGVVFLTVGASLVIAAWRHDPGQARGTAGALRMLADPFGGLLLVPIGLGLAAYGIYGWINARYRIIDA